MATFQFNNPSASSYFVIQTVTTSSDYPVGTPKYMEGTWFVDYVETYAGTTIDYTNSYLNYINYGSSSFSINSINFVFTSSVLPPNTNDTIYIDVASYGIGPTAFQLGAIAEYSNYYSTPPYDAFLIEIVPVTVGFDSINFFYVGNNQTYGNTIPYSVDGVPGIFSGGSKNIVSYLFLPVVMQSSFNFYV
jgi:hypothetical protein